MALQSIYTWVLSLILQMHFSRRKVKMINVSPQIAVKLHYTERSQYISDEEIYFLEIKQSHALHRRPVDCNWVEHS